MDSVASVVAPRALSSQSSHIPHAPQTSHAPQISHAPQTTPTPQKPHASPPPDAPKTPLATQTPHSSPVPQAPQTPLVAQTPRAPLIPHAAKSAHSSPAPRTPTKAAQATEASQATQATEDAQATPSAKATPPAQATPPAKATPATQAAQSTQATPPAQAAAPTPAAQLIQAIQPQSPRQQARRRAEARTQARTEPLPVSDMLKVIVTGYPGYTQAQDLLRVFSKIGNVKVERVYARCAVLAFSTPEEAIVALQSNKKYNIYGQFVGIKPYSDKFILDEGRQAMRRDYKKTKQKVPTIDPVKIDLTGDFPHQVDSILAAVRLSHEHVATLSKLYNDVELVLQSLWPGCTAIPFGSITTGLGIKSSDADCFVNIPPQFRHPNANYVIKAKRLLQQHPKYFAEILSIPRANTPIVKFYHVPTETYCDLTFKTPLGAQNSKLITFLLHLDRRLIPMAVIIKYWAKVHDLSGTGKLTNYALTMMIIFYLQQPHVAVLPSVEYLQRDSSNDVMVDFWNTGFMNKMEYIRPNNNRSSLSELLGGFFEFYSIFNFDDVAVCPYLGFPYKKMAFRDIYALPKEFDRYKSNVIQGNVMPMRFNTPMCVQDPFEQSHNVASAITPRLAHDIKAYFKFASTVYEKEKINKCENFLRIILLQKPKLVRGKFQPEYRVNLFPRIISTIVNTDWKTVVRDIVFTIFEKMMRIKLGKLEEKVNPDTMKEKEKYSGALTKAIWKRKQFNRAFASKHLEFQEKQERITEEIILTDPQEFSVEFQLTIIFTHEPRNVVVSVQQCSGEVEAFREYAKFFITVTKPWFEHQLGKYYTDGKVPNHLQGLDQNGQVSDEDTRSSGGSPKDPEEQEAAPPASPPNDAEQPSAHPSPNIECKD